MATTRAKKQSPRYSASSSDAEIEAEAEADAHAHAHAEHKTAGVNSSSGPA